MGDNPRPYRGKLADPNFRRERARKAGLARHGVDAQIRALTASAPQLTADQVEALRRLLPPVDEDDLGGDAA
jgi:hypothetical protein